MAEFEKEEFRFPDEETKGKPLKAADEVEYIVEDDTPPEDKGQKPMPKEIVEKLEAADEESEELDPKTQKERIKQYKKVWNDERRAKEAALREQQEAIDLAKRVIEENKKLKAQYSAGEKPTLKQCKVLPIPVWLWLNVSTKKRLSLVIQTVLLRRRLLFQKQHTKHNR